ncbi:uncharacterized protein LOC116844052 isoform X2 [Odontomachus brunneus]|uniref:uncharacterized protein LOC116844052 isoform X2 n=1 Tax=Odontomachus brunneus TaxID=486640 RepID=UPI0013F1F07B|nr:uncharacterized protein LOC116844052 isoform X2 [Odontomachus brunneus]
MSQFLGPAYDFFNPNICHFCKTPWHLNFITCDQCHMISYCTMYHKSRNNESHMQICAALQNVSRSHPYFWSTLGINLEEWIQTRKQFIRLVKLALQRDLQPYEEQMITLAKSCIICYRQDNLLCCPKCHSINYCRNHKKLLGNRHRVNCNKLKLCLSTNRDMHLYPIIIDIFTEFPTENKLTVDMKAFVNQYVCPTHWIDEITSVGCSICLYYSDYASGPLTLYDGIQKINRFNYFHKLESCLVIHIIGANFVDIDYLSAWELLLHLLPNVKELKIILIGPELCTKSNGLRVCTIRCVQQRLNFEAHRMLYHNYVDSKCYKRPDVIIGFQVDLSDWEALSEIILKIKAQECPFLITSNSKDKAKQNVNKIKEILKSPICDVLYLVYNSKNNFKSNRPYQDVETAGVSYRNKEGTSSASFT